MRLGSPFPHRPSSTFGAVGYLDDGCSKSVGGQTITSSKRSFHFRQPGMSVSTSAQNSGP